MQHKTFGYLEDYIKKTNFLELLMLLLPPSGILNVLREFYRYTVVMFSRKMQILQEYIKLREI